jgi:hypothetical protein
MALERRGARHREPDHTCTDNENLHGFPVALSVIAGLDPAIHPFRKMDARVKPAHDVERFEQAVQQKRRP